MTISDAQRHKLHSKLDQVLGEEDAAVLISHLPPSGWSDVARTRDLDQLAERLEAKMDAGFASVDARFDLVDARFGIVDERFARVEERFEARFERVDERFDTMEARFDAKLERALREQTNRFLVSAGLMLTVATTVQAVVAQLVG